MYPKELSHEICMLVTKLQNYNQSNVPQEPMNW